MTNEEKPVLLPLHPKELSDEEFSAYEMEFEKVLSDPFCRNIALSGPYGAGKSSVMEKVKKEQQKQGKKWIAISLATFGEAGGKQKLESSLSQNDVEAEILRQMVHKIGTSMAPKSRFRRLCDRKPATDAFIAALMLVFALLATYLASISSKLLSFQLSCIDSFAFIAWLVIAGAGIYRLIRTNMISRMASRVKIFEAEFEIAPPDSKSPYERCADEIVYLLNASKVDAVIFEDLDRFDSMAIFERKRNRKPQANDSRPNDTKGEAEEKKVKPLKFFFLVRDGLFENPHDRTKFFDYVIPVVPYIEPHSALGIFRNALNGVGITVDEGFLYQLSSYIDDPRIVHDIANEAYHYKKFLFETRSFIDGDSERLTALLAYKALFPRDFELLQAGRGYLHEVLNGKQRLIARLTGDDETEYAKLQNELDNINRQLEVSEDELICMFGASELSNIAQNLRGFNDPSNFDPHSFLEAARNNAWVSQQLKALLQQLKSNDLYQTRLLEIRDDADSRSNVIRARQKQIRDKSETLRPMTIKQLINELPDADDLFDFKDSDIERGEDFEELSMNTVLSSPSFPMLRFLVSSGYIDESYRRYISNFYSDTLCAEDDNYLSAIKQAKSIDLSYQPKKPGEIIRRMEREEFSRIGIRNPWLVSTLLSSGNVEKIDTFVSSVKRSGGVRYLAEFIASEHFTPEIFAWIHARFDGAIAQLLGDEEISTDDKRCFCKRCLVNGDGLNLLDTENDIFADYIDSDPRFLEEDPRFDDAEIEKGLLRVGYCAKTIDFQNASSALLNFVYDNRLFTPAPQIVDNYLNLKFGISGSMGLGTLITEVLKLPGCPIKDVVSENMEHFVSRVARESKASLKEASESVVSVLNEKSIQAETAKAFIEALAGVEIEDIDQVDSVDYKNNLLAAQLVKCSADNVISFYRRAENSITDDLAKLIEAKGAPSDLNTAKCEEAEVDAADIVGKIIKREEISIEHKKTILAGCGFKFPSFDIDELDGETVKAMLEFKTIEMNCDMLEKFRACKPDLELDYILSDLDGFLALIDTDSPDGAEWEIEEDEVADLLESNIDTIKKLAALSCFDGTIRLEKGYEVEVNAAIVAEHFDSSDVANLPSYYENATEKLRNQIARAFAVHDEVVMADGVDFGMDLLYDSLKHLKGNRDEALRLLAWYFEKHENEIDRDNAMKCFETAELRGYAKLIGGSASMIPQSDVDDRMLLILDHLGMCGAISTEANAEGLRKVHPKGYRRAK